MNSAAGTFCITIDFNRATQQIGCIRGEKQVQNILLCAQTWRGDFAEGGDGMGAKGHLFSQGKFLGSASKVSAAGSLLLGAGIRAVKCIRSLVTPSLQRVVAWRWLCPSPSSQALINNSLSRLRVPRKHLSRRYHMAIALSAPSGCRLASVVPHRRRLHYC